MQWNSKKKARGVCAERRAAGDREHLEKSKKAHKRLFTGKSGEGEVRLLKDPVTCWEFGKHFEGTKVTENLSLVKKYSQR